MKAKYPFAFEPGYEAPEEPGDEPHVFAFRKRELLVTVTADLPSLSDVRASGITRVRTQYLGRLSGRHCYSAELDPDAPAPDGLDFRDLRMLFGTLDEQLHAVAGRAVQVVEWDRSHRYCGVCGKPTIASKIERMRSCPDCKLPLYPRLAPAMIVAVEKDDEILLGRSPHFPKGIYSALAGFVEPGESAEEAVVREVHEETRIVVDNVRYFASQPWPFPNSLMLGFTAQFKAGEIDTSSDELEDAAWYRYDDLPKMFPGNISISQWLVRDFAERRQKKRGT